MFKTNLDFLRRNSFYRITSKSIKVFLILSHVTVQMTSYIQKRWKEFYENLNLNYWLSQRFYMTLWLIDWYFYYVFVFHTWYKQFKLIIHLHVIRKCMLNKELFVPPLFSLPNIYIMININKETKLSNDIHVKNVIAWIHGKIVSWWT